MSIKISSLRSLLKHSENFVQEKNAFLEEIEAGLGENIEFTELSDYNCDLKLIFVETGGSEGLFLEALPDLKEPFYLLTSGGNNSLAASLEIMTWIGLNGKKGEILHGGSNYLVKRIRELATIERARKELAKARLGVVGKPSNWLIASVPDYSVVKENMGIELVDIDLKEMEEGFNECNDTSLSIKNSGFEKSEIDKAAKISNLMKGLIEKYSLNGLTIRCFDLLGPLSSTGCLGLAELNDAGLIGTCEGDIMAMISMYLVKVLTCQEAFQANPSRIDVEKGEITFAHCTVPTKMLEDYVLDTHFESGIGVAIRGKLKKQKVTIFRLSADLEHYFLETGEIIETPSESNLCRTQIVVKMDGGVDSLLKNPAGNHHIIFYGDHKNLIEGFLG